ncbi:integrative and conjugative element protein, VC0181 family [Microbacterium sp. 77mftsu3.1]|nr:integrative and conjugative element protein, VC0181 family [Microbacterium sp. 77mftsu3.1]
MHRSALELIMRESVASLDGTETGGLVLGSTEFERIEIRHAGGPGPRARRTASTFDRDLNHAQLIAADAWERDRSQWIGEWHTHPHGPLAPSGRDITSYQAHLRDPDLGFQQFVCLIVGAPRDGTTPLTAWIVRPSSIQPATLVLDEEE